jgi:3-hydroxyisobutyrate dehydrogenase-like beta-hydroxyacid dehydrogenase
MDNGIGGGTGTACAVIGTGDMGFALAAALLGSGHRVVVWNRTPARYAALIERGAEAADSVAAAVSAADLVVVCLLDYATSVSVLGADGVADSLSGRTLLQFSFSNGGEAAALEQWVKQQGGDYLHGQIKAYPREVGTPEARLNYSGTESTFETFRRTVAVFGEPVYLGADVAAACVISNTSTILYSCIVAAFFEAAAYAAAEGAELGSLIAGLPTGIRLAQTTIEYSAGQIAAGVLTGDQASIDTHANGLTTLVRAMAKGGRPQPRIAGVVLDLLEEARSNGLGSLEIAALYGMLAESLGAPDSA